MTTTVYYQEGQGGGGGGKLKLMWFCDFNFAYCFFI